MEVLRWGYRIPFRSTPPLSSDPIPFPSYSPSSIRGKAPEREVVSLVEKGAVELAPLPSPGFYSRLFVVMKASGSWRPIIDLSTLNLRILKSPFKMETLQSVLLSVRSGDWMVSLDLKDAYLKVPIHLDSHKYLRFVAFNQVYQFKVLCFGLSTAPQVCTRVMAPVSTFLHCAGIRISRYLDDWLVQAPSRALVLQALDTVLQLCQDLGNVVNREKSHLVPSQRVVYLGVILDSLSFRASPSQPRIEKLLSIGDKFLSFVTQPVSSWRVLLGVLSSLTPLVTEVSPASAPSLVGSSRQRNLSSVGRLLPAGSGVVVGEVSSEVGCLSSAGIPRPRLLVRHVRCGWKRSLQAFGLQRSQTSLSTPESSWQWRGVCSSFAIFSQIHSGHVRGQLYA